MEYAKLVDATPDPFVAQELAEIVDIVWPFCKALCNDDLSVTINLTNKNIKYNNTIIITILSGLMYIIDLEIFYFISRELSFYCHYK